MLITIRTKLCLNNDNELILNPLSVMLFNLFVYSRRAIFYSHLRIRLIAGPCDFSKNYSKQTIKNYEL